MGLQGVFRTFVLVLGVETLRFRRLSLGIGVKGLAKALRSIVPIAVACTGFNCTSWGSSIMSISNARVEQYKVGLRLRLVGFRAEAGAQKERTGNWKFGSGLLTSWKRKCALSYYLACQAQGLGDFVSR